MYVCCFCLIKALANVWPQKPFKRLIQTGVTPLKFKCTLKEVKNTSMSIKNIYEVRKENHKAAFFHNDVQNCLSMVTSLKTIVQSEMHCHVSIE